MRLEALTYLLTCGAYLVFVVTAGLCARRSYADRTAATRELAAATRELAAATRPPKETTFP